MKVMQHQRDRFEPLADVMVTAGGSSGSDWADWVAAKLEPHGVGVERVHTVEQALQRVRRGPLSLAVLDTRLPRTGGLGLLRRIRSLDAALPCVLMGEEMRGRDLQTALELNAYSVVTAPIRERVMRDLIAGVFRRYYESELVL